MLAYVIRIWVLWAWRASALDTLPCRPCFPGLMCLSTSSKGGSLLMGAGTPWRKDHYLAYLARACRGLSEREGFCCCCLVLCLFYQVILWDLKAESSHPHTGRGIFLCHSISFTLGFIILFGSFVLWDPGRETVNARGREGDGWTCSFSDEYVGEAYIMEGVGPVWWFGYSDTQPTFRNNVCRMGWILLSSSPHEPVLK